MTPYSQQIVGSFGGSVPTVRSAPLPRSGGGGSVAANSGGGRYASHASWGARSFEAAETNRLNRAHWRNARDCDINEWLMEQLSTLRARATYETRNNGMLAGVTSSLVDDVVGPDGPMLEVQSGDDVYNQAVERVWREWFKAPTFRPNVSGASWLKLCVRNFPRCGEFLCVIGTDPKAEGPVQMRLRPIHPRRLATPFDQAGNPHIKMGIEFDKNDCPRRYWIREDDGLFAKYVPYSPDDVIHEFILDEEGQARGFPWLTPALQSAADLRDYDSDVMHASRRAASDNGMMYTDHPDAPVWSAPETTTIEPGVIPMAPPGWKPFAFPSTMPAANYPDFRAEKQRDFGRAFNMPLLMVRLDSSRHNYSSARLDTQSWNRAVEGIQDWLSGTPESCGTLSRLVDLVVAEARFSVSELRRRPKEVAYLWTWPPRPHVDPAKEADAETVALETGTLDMATALAARGTTLERHVRAMKRAIKAFEDAEVPLPAWMSGGEPAKATPDGRKERANAKQEEPASA